MMGSGKSTVGRRLAERLGCCFVDTDAEIEREASASVAEIFAREGEAGFRVRERAAIEALLGAEAVVSLGGGAVAQAGIGEALASTGTIVYLRARPETLLRRVGDGDTRPLLRGLDGPGRVDKLRSLLEARAEHYERAQIVIDTDENEVDTVVDELARHLAREST
jgi:shikimate kinase